MLYELGLTQTAKIASQQVSEHIESQLWELGLLPNTAISIAQKATQFVEVQQNGKAIRVPMQLARSISVEQE